MLIERALHQVGARRCTRTARPAPVSNRGNITTERRESTFLLPLLIHPRRFFTRHTHSRMTVSRAHTRFRRFRPTWLLLSLSGPILFAAACGSSTGPGDLSFLELGPSYSFTSTVSEIYDCDRSRPEPIDSITCGMETGNVKVLTFKLNGSFTLTDSSRSSDTSGVMTGTISGTIVSCLFWVRPEAPCREGPSGPFDVSVFYRVVTCVAPDTSPPPTSTVGRATIKVVQCDDHVGETITAVDFHIGPSLIATYYGILSGRRLSGNASTLVEQRFERSTVSTAWRVTRD